MQSCALHHFEDDNVIKNCNDKQYGYLNRAMNLALKSTCYNQRHGCVIVKDDEIISEGYNHTSVHLYHKFSVHAEVDALTKLKRNKKFMANCDLYVVRVGRDSMGNPLKYSRPCQDCIKAIQKSGVRKVYYSSNLEFEQFIMDRDSHKHGKNICHDCSATGSSSLSSSSSMS